MRACAHVCIVTCTRLHTLTNIHMHITYKRTRNKGIFVCSCSCTCGHNVQVLRREFHVHVLTCAYVYNFYVHVYLHIFANSRAYIGVSSVCACVEGHVHVWADACRYMCMCERMFTKVKIKKILVFTQITCYTTAPLCNIEIIFDAVDMHERKIIHDILHRCVAAAWPTCPVSRSRSSRRPRNNANFEYNGCDFNMHTHHT